MTTTTRSSGVENSLTTGLLPRFAPLGAFAGGLLIALVLGLLLASFDFGGVNWGFVVVIGACLGVLMLFIASLIVEGSRRAKDRLMGSLVVLAFLVALAPLISLLITVVANGLHRMDATFFTQDMRTTIGDGGGALHAIIGTAWVTLFATVISVPIGLMCSIYLVEYSRGGRLARAITFFVDVMTGIPSIVAGLFAFALVAFITGSPRIFSDFLGAIALSVLMIPVVIRSTEEMLRLVPHELREAAYALGVPKYLTILKVVLPTAMAGIMTGVMLSIARVIGETAPLLIAVNFSKNFEYNPFGGPSATLPTYAYTMYSDPGRVPEYGHNRAWAAALVLIAIVMVLNILARVLGAVFAPKKPRRKKTPVKAADADADEVRTRREGEAEAAIAAASA